MLFKMLLQPENVALHHYRNDIKQTIVQLLQQQSCVSDYHIAGLHNVGVPPMAVWLDDADSISTFQKHIFSLLQIHEPRLYEVDVMLKAQESALNMQVMGYVIWEAVTHPFTVTIRLQEGKIEVTQFY